MRNHYFFQANARIYLTCSIHIAFYESIIHKIELSDQFMGFPDIYDVYAEFPDEWGLDGVWCMP